MRELEQQFINFVKGKPVGKAKVRRARASPPLDLTPF